MGEENVSDLSLALWQKSPPRSRESDLSLGHWGRPTLGSREGSRRAGINVCVFDEGELPVTQDVRPSPAMLVLQELLGFHCSQGSHGQAPSTAPSLLGPQHMHPRGAPMKSEHPFVHMYMHVRARLQTNNPKEGSMNGTQVPRKQAILPPPFGASSFSHTSLDPLMGTTQGPFEDSTQGLLEGSAPGLRKGSVQGLFEDSAQGPLDGSTQGPLEGSAPGSRKDSPQGPAEDSAQAFAVATKGALAAARSVTSPQCVHVPSKAEPILETPRAKKGEWKTSLKRALSCILVSSRDTSSKAS
uniref:Uncharacterized protein n=2 Tax=Dunaliella tertiolecta TaxID=3047 RepID=A0A7S3QWG9_DUNTE|mmetsp:Transcript_12238/g.33411  ORF Transcript_12238/g.33411 Transcript_12238/m.33411 type:complete len:299 (-) Transcript_12238:1429-2325(-)